MVSDTDKSGDGNAANKIPALREILLNTSLYHIMVASPNDEDKVYILRESNFQIDAFCIKCNDRSIFKTHRPSRVNRPISISNSISNTHEASSLSPGSFACSISCVRCSTPYTYYFKMSKDGLMKIGQYPSLEDIGSGELIKYRNILDKGDYGELKRAAGLAAHGIGIGSFVYLRRIFERLIYKHRDSLVERGNPIPDFDGMRMDDKIKALSSVLPPALVEHRKVYAILSIGIHALDEAACRKYFPVVKSAILQILDQDVAAKEAAAAEIKLRQEIAAIISEVNGRDEAV